MSATGETRPNRSNRQTSESLLLFPAGQPCSHCPIGPRPESPLRAPAGHHSCPASARWRHLPKPHGWAGPSHLASRKEASRRGALGAKAQSGGLRPRIRKAPEASGGSGLTGPAVGQEPRACVHPEVSSAGQLEGSLHALSFTGGERDTQGSRDAEGEGLDVALPSPLPTGGATQRNLCGSSFIPSFTHSSTPLAKERLLRDTASGFPICKMQGATATCWAVTEATGVTSQPSS